MAEQPSRVIRAPWSPAHILTAIGAGIVGALIGLLLVGEDPSPAELFLVVVPFQLAAQAVVLVFVSRRSGAGSLAADYGLRTGPRMISAFFIGAGAQLGFLVLNAVVLTLIDSDGVAQGIVEDTEEAAASWVIVAAVLVIGVAAPFIEELMFRGLMLRPLLLRGRSTAILATAGAFAATHVLDIDPTSLFAWVVIAELFLLGLYLAHIAIEDGSLARPIAMHMGFNTVPLVFLYLSTLVEVA